MEKSIQQYGKTLTKITDRLSFIRDVFHDVQGDELSLSCYACEGVSDILSDAIDNLLSGFSDVEREHKKAREVTA